MMIAAPAPAGSVEPGGEHDQHQQTPEFQRCLDAGADYSDLADLVWACVEAGIHPSTEVLVFFQPDDSGQRVADGEIPKDHALGGQITTVLTVVANSIPSPERSAEAVRLARASLPRLFDLYSGLPDRPGLSRAAVREDMRAWRELLHPDEILERGPDAGLDRLRHLATRARSSA